MGFLEKLDAGVQNHNDKKVTRTCKKTKKLKKSVLSNHIMWYNNWAIYIKKQQKENLVGGN